MVVAVVEDEGTFFSTTQKIVNTFNRIESYCQGPNPTSFAFHILQTTTTARLQSFVANKATASTGGRGGHVLSCMEAT